KVLPPEKAKSDANLENVLAEILKNEFPLENKVNFTVTDGKVVLNGKTNTLWARYNIAETFKNVRGIKSVENNINVQSVM
ncbi:MAG: BON domain-containing protein, partial [Calditrichaceae bacterium]